MPLSHTSYQTMAYIFILLLVSFIPSPSRANDLYLEDYVDNLSYAKVTFYVGLGQREGELRWNIASDASGNRTPNILSELTFADLSIFEVQGGVNIRFNHGILRNIRLEGNIKSGTNSDGLVTDSDYDGDNRTNEYSRSESNPDGSTTLDGKFILGYEMQWSEHIVITPLFGYRYNRQSLKMKEGVQILDTRPVALSLGPFSSQLNSAYEAEWNSAIFGLETQYRSQRHQLSLRLEYTLADYYAEANWNLRSDFAHPKSFAHWARGTGNNIEFRYQYNVSPSFSLWVSYRLEDWVTNEGDDTVYFSDGTKAGTQLNEVVWESNAKSAGFSLNF